MEAPTKLKIHYYLWVFTQKAWNEFDRDMSKPTCSAHYYLQYPRNRTSLKYLSTHKRVEKIGHIYARESCSPFEMKAIQVIFNTIDESESHYIKWNKPVIEW